MNWDQIIEAIAALELQADIEAAGDCFKVEAANMPVSFHTGSFDVERALIDIGSKLNADDVKAFYPEGLQAFKRAIAKEYQTQARIRFFADHVQVIGVGF